MTGTSWLIDSQRIASKIKNASGSLELNKQKWMSNPTKECPRCSQIIDNSDVVHEWPGLPKGVKFDPSDQELLWHLLAKHGEEGAKAHPFIDEFIPTVEEEDGICYTHPQKLPGLKQDGSISHFFHKTFKAYNTGIRKRRKINTDDLADVRWHKTGKTKPVIVDGKHLGCKKIMVLYMSIVKSGKPKKTNWVMHQYHLGTGEDEKNGEYVVSKLFFQQLKPAEHNAQESNSAYALEAIADEANPPDNPLAPEEHLSSITNQDVLCINEHCADQEALQSDGYNADQENWNTETNMEGNVDKENVVDPSSVKQEDGDIVSSQDPMEENVDNVVHPSSEIQEDGGIPSSQDQKWWEGESQFLLSSQQLAENLAICNEFLQSQSQTSCGSGDEPHTIKPRLSVYAQLPVEDLKMDLEECQELGPSDAANLDHENTSEFRLSQIEFSQDSFQAPWAGGKLQEFSQDSFPMPWAGGKITD